MTETEQRELQDTLEDIKKMSELRTRLGELVYESERDAVIDYLNDTFYEVDCQNWLLCRLEDHYQISLRPEPTARLNGRRKK